MRIFSIRTMYSYVRSPIHSGKQHERFGDRRPHAPGKRDADEQPESQYQTAVTAPPAHCRGIAADGGPRCGVVRELALRFEFGVSHEPFRFYRTHQQVADETADQQRREDVHRGVVSGALGYAMLDLVIVDVVHDHRTEHTGGGPRSQQATMDGAHHLRAEHVGEIRWNGGEATAIHGEDDAEKADEKRHVARMPRPRCRRVQNETEREEREVRYLAPDVVGQRGPDETPRYVEQAQQAGKTGGDRRDLAELFFAEFVELQVQADQPATEDFLQHRRSHADDADARRHVQHQNAPQQPELRRLVRV